MVRHTRPVWSFRGELVSVEVYAGEYDISGLMGAPKDVIPDGEVWVECKLLAVSGNRMFWLTARDFIQDAEPIDPAADDQLLKLADKAGYDVYEDAIDIGLG